MFDELFKNLLDAEQEAFAAEKDMQRIMLDNNLNVLEKKKAVEEAWKQIEIKMSENKLDKVWIKGEHTNYVISRSKPRETVDIADVDALPEKFVRVKKEPMKKELLELLKQCRDTNNPMPNYATLVIGESKLNWRAVKMGEEAVA